MALSLPAGAVGLTVARASFTPEVFSASLNSWTYPVAPSFLTLAIGGSETRLMNPLRKKELKNRFTRFAGAPVPTSSTGFRVIVADADFEPSAVAVAVTVTFAVTLMMAGAV